VKPEGVKNKKRLIKKLMRRFLFLTFCGYAGLAGRRG
jgi:hypothetical protein